MAKNKEKKNYGVKPSKVDSIFMLVNNGEDVRIASGNHLVSEKEFKNEAEAEKYIKSKPYELICNLCCVIFKSMSNEKELQEALKKSA